MGLAYIRQTRRVLYRMVSSGYLPKFVRGRSASFIEVTFSTQRIAMHVHNWTVMELENLTVPFEFLYGFL